jgi:hypothetical protein
VERPLRGPRPCGGPGNHHKDVGVDNHGDKSSNCERYVCCLLLHFDCSTELWPQLLFSMIERNVDDTITFYTGTQHKGPTTRDRFSKDSK